MNDWTEEYYNLERKVEIIDNVLPEELCEKILNNYGDKLQVDRTNRHSWPDSIMSPTTGLVLINDLDKDLSLEIIEHITNNTNFTTDTNKGMFYRWTPLAYITKHTDYGYAQAISIYLNKDWETDDGGIFMYRMNKDDNWIGVEPIYNRACISYGDIEHWTTPVTGNKDRKSIQIFGHEY